MRCGFTCGRRLVLALLAALPLGACSDELPTVAGEEFFPGGARPATFQVIVPAERFARLVGEFSGFTGPEDAGFLLVANRFDGALEAHTLARLANFPRSVSFQREGTTRTDTVFTFVQGQVLAPVDTLASEAEGPVTLRLWEVGQEWDFGSVSWQLAVDTAGVRVPWSNAGGTRGALLSEVTIPSARAADTLRFPLDSATVQRVSREDFPGFLVTAEGSPARIQLRRLALRAEVRPQSAADTIISVDVGARGDGQTFIFTPDVPSSADAWEAGGIRSARTLFRVDLGVQVPGCAAGCPDVPLTGVTINEVSLLFDPVPVPQGFRPLEPVGLLVRRVAEPELGPRAPLGEVVNDVVGLGPTPGSTLFGGGSFAPGDPVLAVPVTQFATELIEGDSTTATLVLLGDPQVGSFGPAWFAGSPRLRIVYTVPVRPTTQP